MRECTLFLIRVVMSYKNSIINSMINVFRYAVGDAQTIDTDKQKEWYLMYMYFY